MRSRPGGAIVQRISLVGVPGSGKTTAGRRLAGLLGLPFIELDAIMHQAGWCDLPVNEFRTRVRDAVRGDGWVVDGNYADVRDTVWERADTVVWLDLPRRVAMRRIVLRTVRRALTRQELWNGNREPLSNFYRWDPQKNVIRWAWVKYPEYAERYRDAMEDPSLSAITFIRLRSAPAVERFLRQRSS
jgi:adenylate kinase family enzyme